jgi:hypothetical protein
MLFVIFLYFALQFAKSSVLINVLVDCQEFSILFKIELFGIQVFKSLRAHRNIVLGTDNDLPLPSV